MRPEIETRLKANAAVVTRTAASAIRPDPRMKVSEWAEEHRIVPEDVSALPGSWRNDVAPYLVEIMDRLSPDDPCEEVVCMKCSQSGGSALAENWLGFIMHMAPGPAMYIAPTVKAAKDWKIEKLDPTIQATAVLDPVRGGVVSPQRSRSGEGSTSDRIKFKGGYLLLSGANSAATLRQHSIRFQVKDDFDGWTDDAEGEGDPDKLADARTKTYRRFGLSKVFSVSSPLDKGASRIERRYLASDLRRYYMACPGCGSLTDWDWPDVKRNPDPPYRCHVDCPACGLELTEADKPAMLAAENGACWIPTAPDRDGVVPPKTIAPDEIEHWHRRDTGRFTPGYWITGVMNAFDRWDLIAKVEDEAGDDPDLVKPFINTVLGWPYEAKGEGPAWEVLSARREGEWQRGTVPAGVLYITTSVDVSADGIWWEAVGWGPGKQSWLIDYGYLAGETDAALEGAWPKLDAVVDRGFSLGHGARVGADLIAVDSGYNVDAVYPWVKRRSNALAVKGVEGWSKPAVFRAENAEVKKYGLSAGKARRFGLKVWLIGTYGLKSALMVYLGREAKEGGAGFPTGYHHFPADTEEEYFRHLVSEYIKVVEEKGEPVRRWVRKGANHWLDCRVYNWALTYYANLWVWDEARWERRAAELAELTRTATPDLFEQPQRSVLMPGVAPADETEVAPPVAPAPSVSRRRVVDDGLDALASLNR